jgi:hypothetical protein
MRRASPTNGANNLVLGGDHLTVRRDFAPVVFPESVRSMMYSHNTFACLTQLFCYATLLANTDFIG